jgi:hypothetical protein
MRLLLARFCASLGKLVKSMHPNCAVECSSAFSFVGAYTEYLMMALRYAAAGIFFATGKLQISLKNLASCFLRHVNSKKLIGGKI